MAEERKEKLAQQKKDVGALAEETTTDKKKDNALAEEKVNKLVEKAESVAAATKPEETLA